MSVLLLDYDTRKLGSRPMILEGDSPETNVVAVDKGDDTGTGVGIVEPGAPLETKGSAVGNPVRVQWLTRV